jgi:hypothetical protein
MLALITGKAVSQDFRSGSVRIGVGTFVIGRR